MIEIPYTALYFAGLVMALPGLILSGVLLWKVLGSAGAFAIVLLIWVAGTPWLALVGTSALTPGILGQSHAYGGWQTFWRVWVPASAFPVLATLILWGAIRVVTRLRRLGGGRPPPPPDTPLELDR